MLRYNSFFMEHTEWTLTVLINWIPFLPKPGYCFPLTHQGPSTLSSLGSWALLFLVWQSLQKWYLPPPPIFGCLETCGVPGPGIRSELQMWPKQQLWQGRVLDPPASRWCQDISDPVEPWWELQWYLYWAISLTSLKAQFQYHFFKYQRGCHFTGF